MDDIGKKLDSVVLNIEEINKIVKSLDVLLKEVKTALKKSKSSN